MGFREVSLVFDEVGILPPAQKLILVALADRTNEDAQSWPSVRELMRRTCQSRASIFRHLTALEKLGIIEVKARRRVDEDGRSRQTTNIYTLDIQGMQAGSYRQKSSGSQFETQTNTDLHKTRSGSESQFETQEVSGSQNPGFQGLTGETPRKTNLTTNLPPNPPSSDFSETAFDSSRSASPLGGLPSGNPGENSSLTQNSLRVFDDEQQASETVEDPGVITPLEDPTGGQVQVGLSDLELVSQVLPEAMQALPPRDFPKIGGLIRERIAAGWAVDDLRAGLEARALPTSVRHLTALVVARFRDDLPVNAAPATPRHRPQQSPLVDAGGNEIKSYEIDWGRAAQDRRVALKAGLISHMSNQDFIREVGVENYIIGKSLHRDGMTSKHHDTKTV